VGEHKVGDSVKITFDRNGTTHTVDIVLEEMPQEDR
jgi:serine protease Do